nr:DUF4143 domain-containing protein [Mesocricetibacter intestinalis]
MLNLQGFSLRENTVKRWITILEALGIIYLLKPYDNNHLKRC